MKRSAVALWLAVLTWLLCQSCVPERSPVGLPCRDQGDCWRKTYCIEGKCQDKASPESVRESAPLEPSPDASPRETP